MNRLVLPLIGLAGLSSVACSHTAYRSSLNAAEVRLGEARERGAESDAPYEYYFARVQLTRAREETSADDAASAEVLAQKGLDTARGARPDARDGRAAGVSAPQAASAD